MTNLPTESRIFDNRYFREVKRLEALHAGRLSPGSTTWRQAVPALYAGMQRSGSPTKRATILNKAIGYLNGVKPEETAHIMFGHSGGSRSASLCFASFNVGLHPFVGVDEEGLHVMQHLIHCDRNGHLMGICDINLAYVSGHAIGRLHEREYDLTSMGATGVLAFIGVLGYLTRNSEKHIAGELCLHFGDTLVVGSLKHAPKDDGHGGTVNGTLYDVRTALPADEVRNRDMLQQGRIASQVVASWVSNPSADTAVADLIPFLPRRANDYTMQAAVRH